MRSGGVEFRDLGGESKTPSMVLGKFTPSSTVVGKHPYRCCATSR